MCFEAPITDWDLVMKGLVSTMWSAASHCCFALPGWAAWFVRR